jgi:hypothetical protein
MASRRNDLTQRLVWTEANIQALLVAAFFVSPRSRAAGFATNTRYRLDVCGGCMAEADLLLVKLSGRVVEFEIKLTRADFLADQKHKRRKHDLLVQAFITPKDLPRSPLPNEITYVVPASMNLSPDEVPEYAGLMVVTDAGRLQIVKRAPVIHTHKFEAFNNLTTPLSWRLAKGMQVQYEDEQTDAIPTI